MRVCYTHGGAAPPGARSGSSTQIATMPRTKSAGESGAENRSHCS
jgi:hypothetical protein